MKNINILLDEQDLYLSDRNLAYVSKFLHWEDFKYVNLNILEEKFLIDRKGATNLMHNWPCQEKERLTFDVDDKTMLFYIKALVTSVISALDTEPEVGNNWMVYRNQEILMKMMVYRNQKILMKMPFNDLIDKMRRYHGQK